MKSKRKEVDDARIQTKIKNEKNIFYMHISQMFTQKKINKEHRKHEHLSNKAVKIFIILHMMMRVALLSLSTPYTHIFRLSFTHFLFYLNQLAFARVILFLSFECAGAVDTFSFWK